MLELGQLALHLVPIALTSVVHAVGKAVDASKPSSATSILTEAVSGLATESITKAAALFKKEEKNWSSVNNDLDSVVT